MKINNSIVILLPVLVILYGCNHEQPVTASTANGSSPGLNGHSSSIPEVPPDVHFDKRTASVDKVVAAIVSVTKRTKNTEAKNLSELIQANFVLGMPVLNSGQIAMALSYTNDGRQKPAAHADGQLLLIAPVLKEDPQQWQDHLENNRLYAQYLPEASTIVFNHTEKISNDWLGLAILHESHHWIKVTTIGPAMSIEEGCADEVEAYQLEIAVANDISNGRFGKVAEKVAKKVANSMKIVDRNGSKFLEMATGVYTVHREHKEELNQAFGRPASNLENDMRESVLLIAGAFLYLDSLGFGDTEAFNLKAQFISTIMPG